VRGNGEREVAEAAASGIDPETVPPDALPELTAALTAVALGAEMSAWLGALPTTVVLDDVLYCHATPRRDDEMLTRISPPERWAEALGGVEHPLVVAGHTHQQDDRRVGAVRFVNAGSVGLPYEGDSAARWAWISGGTPELRRTAYDAAVAGRRMLASGWPDHRSIEGGLIDPVDPMFVTKLFEGVD
jgi:diadenosine tetraphosphatase ApaH/serine/threonine PP2A family protein phosphatase